MAYVRNLEKEMLMAFMMMGTTPYEATEEQKKQAIKFVNDGLMPVREWVDDKDEDN